MFRKGAWSYNAGIRFYRGYGSCNQSQNQWKALSIRFGAQPTFSAPAGKYLLVEQLWLSFVGPNRHPMNMGIAST